MSTHTKGDYYEQKAALYLEQRGLTVLKKNFRCRQGEIDLVCADGPVLVFVEVKYRRSRGSGEAVSAVDIRKQRKITRAALYYMAGNNRSMDEACRFDVVGFDGDRVEWIRNAFDAVL